MRTLTVLFLWSLVSCWALADIGIEWDQDQYGAITLQDGEVLLTFCPKARSDQGAPSRGCSDRKPTAHVSKDVYTARLYAMNRLPERYQHAQGLAIISRDLELKRRQREQGGIDLENEIQTLEQDQNKLMEIKHRFLNALDEEKENRFYRRSQEEWEQLFSSFSPVWYSGKRLLRLASGAWGDQSKQCQSPWQPWSGNKEVLTDVKRLHIMDTLESKQLWTGGERQLEIVDSRELCINGHGAVPGYFLTVAFDEFGRRYQVRSEKKAEFLKSLPSYGLAVDTSKFDLDSNGFIRTRFPTGRIKHIGGMVLESGSPYDSSTPIANTDPYDYDLAPRDKIYPILCVQED